MNINITLHLTKIFKMEQESKKISFGFSKSTKKVIIIPKPPLAKRDKIQLIDCVEAQTIKLKNAVVEKKGPLVIPLIESTGNIVERRKEQNLRRATASVSVDDRPDADLTPDELAARELIRDAQNLNEKNETQTIYSLPTVTENTLEIEGKEESTIEDYESVPISQYGLAMLRGMGWKENVGLGKNKSCAKIVEPELRPKGMGLGANKGVNSNKVVEPSLDKDGKEVTLKKGGYAKIVDGKQKGSYCEVQGFDDESGRVIVKTTLQGLILSLNEFLVRPVSKAEYTKSSKVINNAKYEEYINKTELVGEKGSISKQDQEKARSSRHRTSSLSSDDADDRSQRRSRENGREDHRHCYKKKSKKKHRNSSYSSSESEKGEKKKYKERTRKSSPLSDHGHKKYRHKKDKKEKNKYKYNNSDSDRDRSHSKESHRYSKHKHARK